MKPSLLAVATVPPWPVNDGYSLRVYHLLRHLSHDWGITLVAPYGEASGGVLPDVERDLRWIEMPWHPDWGFVPSEFDAAELQRRVAAAVQDTPPDASLLWAGTEYLAESLDLPAAVMDKIDCGTLTQWRAARNAPRFREKLRRLRSAWDFLRYEREAARCTRFTVVVGADDARVLERVTGSKGVRIIPNGVVTGSAPAAEDEGPEPTAIFTGVLCYPPNVEAVRWFCEAVWPAVRSRVPNARFVVAGRSPTAEIEALDGANGVVLRADVPDMAAELRPAWIGVAPMRSGSGIKNKVLEAWAAGKPVAMTPLAANGLDMDAEQSGLVGADATELAARVVELLQDDEKRRRLGRAAWSAATDRHGWAAAADAFTALLREAMA